MKCFIKLTQCSDNKKVRVNVSHIREYLPSIYNGIRKTDDVPSTLIVMSDDDAFHVHETAELIDAAIDRVYDENVGGVYSV